MYKYYYMKSYPKKTNMTLRNFPVVEYLAKKVMEKSNKIFIGQILGQKNIKKNITKKYVTVEKRNVFGKVYKYRTRLVGIKLRRNSSYLVAKKKGYSGRDIVTEILPIFSNSLVSLRSAKKEEVL